MTNFLKSSITCEKQYTELHNFYKVAIRNSRWRQVLTLCTLGAPELVNGEVDAGLADL